MPNTSPEATTSAEPTAPGTGGVGVRLEGVSKTYRFGDGSTLTAADDITLTIEAGRFTAKPIMHPACRHLPTDRAPLFYTARSATGTATTGRVRAPTTQPAERVIYGR